MNHNDDDIPFLDLLDICYVKYNRQQPDLFLTSCGQSVSPDIHGETVANLRGFCPYCKRRAAPIVIETVV